METLTLEQAYYMAEMVATIIIVLSLLFVAKQLRQNTLTIMGQSMSNAIQIAQTELIQFGSQETSEIFLKSIKAPEKLTLDEIHQLHAWNLIFMVGRSNDFQQYKLGTLSDARWKVNEKAVEYLFQSKWHRNWLKIGGRHHFPDELIDWVESILDNSSFDTANFMTNLQLKE